MFNLPTYRITPSAHPVKCLPQCPSPSHTQPPPTSPSTTPSSFPRVRSFSCSVSLSDISHSFFSSFTFIPFHYFLYSTNEWDHIMFVLLRLTYFTQHNTLQFHPHWSKWWVFVISNGWGIFHCIHKPHLLWKEPRCPSKDVPWILDASLQSHTGHSPSVLKSPVFSSDRHLSLD